MTPSDSALDVLATATDDAKKTCPVETAGWALVGTILVALAVLSRLGMLSSPFSLDSGLYVYMGKTVAEGGVLYRDFFETKLPGAALITSVFWRLFGRHWTGYVVSQLVLAFATAGLLARAANRHVSPRATVPTFLAGVVLLNFAMVVFTGFQLETIQSFFEAIAALAALEAIAGDRPADAFTTGLAAGAAAMLKPGGLAVAVAFCVTLLFKTSKRKNRVVQLLAVLAGIAVPTGATVLYVYGAGIQSYLPGIIRHIERYANDTPVTGQALVVKLTSVAVLLGWPVLIRLLPGRSRKAVSSTRDAGETVRPAVLCFALLWFAGNLVAVLLQRRMYEYHFYPLLCPAVLLYGMLPGQARPIPVAIGFLPIALLSFQWPRCDLHNMNRAFQIDATSQYVAAHSLPNDAVYADQIGKILIETGLRPGSRYGTFFYFMNYDEAPLEFERGMLRDFENRKPKYVVLRANGAKADQLKICSGILSRRPKRKQNFDFAWTEFNAYIERDYVLETVIDGNNIYKRHSVIDNSHAHMTFTDSDF